MMLAVIRLRGSVKVRKDILATLKLLRLNRKMHCVLLPENPSCVGMLQKAKDYITWGKISDELLEKIVKKRGRKPGNKRLGTDEVSQIISLLKEKGKADNIKPVFRLSPPSGGFKRSIKQAWPKGELGNRGEKINELLERMI